MENSNGNADGWAEKHSEVSMFGFRQLTTANLSAPVRTVVVTEVGQLSFEGRGSLCQTLRVTFSRACASERCTSEYEIVCVRSADVNVKTACGCASLLGAAPVIN